MEKVKFEDALQRLEEIVEALEQQELSLDASLAIFEEGVKLSRACMQQLDEAERKIEILVQKNGGEYEPQSFSPPAAEKSADE